MPRIPTYQPNQVGPVETTGARFRAADNDGGVAGAIAKGLRQLGETGVQYATEQDRLNAQNDDTQARKMAVDFAGQSSAIRQQFTSLQGGNARAAQEGTRKQVDDIRTNLLAQASNPRMRRFLEERLTPLYQDVSQAIDGHAIREQTVERTAALTGEAAMYSDQAISEANATKRQQFIDDGLAAKNQHLDLLGVTDPTARAYELRRYTSGVHRGVIDSMLAQPDPDVEMVQGYLAAHDDEMLADDVGKVERDLQAPMQARQADNDALRAMRGSIPDAPAGVAPVKPGNMAAITAQSESNNRDRNADGSMVTSPKGAMGRMQVMPATARDPGHGIRPWNGKSDDDLARVGTELLTKLMQKYRDPAKAWAAYNWGEARVDKAVKDYGPGWLTAAPKETRDYVAKNTAALDGRHSLEQPMEWDKDKAYNQIDGLADREGWNYERRERAKRRADQIISRDEELKGRAERSADDEALRIVTGLGNSFTSYNQIPSNIRDQLSPEAVARYTRAAEANAAPKEAKANGPTAMTLNQTRILEPERFKTMNLAEYLGEITPGEMDTLLTQQAELKRKAIDWSPSGGINSAISYGKRVSALKLEASEEAAVAQIMETEATALHAKGVTEEQIDYNALFRHATRNVTTTAGWFGRESSLPVYSQNLEMPDAWRDNAIKIYKRENNGRAPTEAELERLFRTTYRFRSPN